jgi:hypothetical protein
MKYKTFRALLIGGVVAAGGGAVALFVSGDRPAAKPVPVAAAPVAAPVPVERPTPPIPTPAADDAGALRPMDEEILAAAKAGISGDKVKDAIPGRPWKVNMYKDAGQAGVNRLKVDLDRDDKWDEKWTLAADGTVERQVSPADDDRTYSETYTLRDGRWQGAGGSAAPVAVAQDAPAGALRPMDQEILRLVERPATTDKIKDAFPSQAYKVNLYHDAGFDSWNRAKIDLDRDEKDDEKWTFEGSGAGRKVKRQVSPADDGQYPEEYRLQGGAWVKK